MAVTLALSLAACGASSAPRVGEPAAPATVTASPAGRLVAVGAGPEGIAVDPEAGLIAVAVRSPAAIVVLDRSGSTLRRVALPSSARHLRFSTSGSLLVPAEQAQQLIQVDVTSGRIVSSTPVGHQPHDAVPFGSRVFVTNEFSDTLSVIEAVQVVATIPAPKQPGGIAASTSVLAVLGVRSHTVRFIDAGSLATIATLPAGAGPTHVVGDGEGRFFVTDTVGNALLTYASSPAPHLVSRRTVQGTPYGIALDTVHARLFLTLTARNQAVEYHLVGDTLAEVARFSTPRQPNTVAADPVSGTVFVTGTADGVVQIMSSFN